MALLSLSLIIEEARALNNLHVIIQKKRYHHEIIDVMIKFCKS